MHKQNCFPVSDIEDLVANLRLNSTECHCTQCAKLCTGVPGAYDPQHVLLMAAQDPDFYGKCVQDFYSSSTRPAFYLRPRIVSEPTGQRTDFFATRGLCNFLGPHGCTLKREDMPLGCVVARGCVSGGPSADKLEAPVIWNTPSGRKAIADFEAYNRIRNRSVGEDEVYQKQMSEITEAGKALNGKPSKVDPNMMLKLLAFTHSLVD